MTEADALLQIASAINHLASAIGGISFTLVLFLFFKNMGSHSYDNSSALNHISNSIDKLAKK